MKKLMRNHYPADDILLTDGSLPVSFSYQHTKSEDGKSIICIQPLNLFNRSTNFTVTISGDISRYFGKYFRYRIAN